MNKNKIIKNPKIEDVADWFLAQESMTHKKLQKLCYYAVAWGYTLNGSAIVNNPEFEAWVHGPVSPILFHKYHKYGWNTITANKKAPFFDAGLVELLKSVWATYGDKDGTELEAISHTEEPWMEARIGLADNDRGNKKIKPQTMKTFYKSIYAGDE